MNISHGSWIRDPRFEISRTEMMRTDRRWRRVPATPHRQALTSRRTALLTVSSGTKSLDFRGFDSGSFFALRGGGVPRCTGNFPENVASKIITLLSLFVPRPISYDYH